jgi:hypothetical protein
MENNSEDEVKFKRMVRVRTVRAFTIFFLSIIGTIFIYRWIINQPREDRTLKPFKRVLDFNSKVFARDYNSVTLAKEFPKNVAVKNVRVNGDAGMKSELDPVKWNLKLIRFSVQTPLPSDTIIVSLDEIKGFPKTEVVFNFKCIEGWSQITWWGGVRFSDLIAKYHIGTINNSEPNIKLHPENMANYCGLITPDKEYYVGIDMPSMMHPQTILCYEMNGQPLPANQGAPLRLIIPVKYGIKHIKRVGMIYFSQQRPPDYWALRGYDYFAGL